MTESSRVDEDEFDEDAALLLLLLMLLFDEDDTRSVMEYNFVVRSEPAIARIVPLAFQDMLRALIRLLMPHS